MISNRVIDWIKILKEKPKMVISESDITYEILRVYVEGFINGIEISLNLDLMKEITKWYMKKVDIKTSYYWTGHIPLHFEGKTDEELKTILLELTEEYFKENSFT